MNAKNLIAGLVATLAAAGAFAQDFNGEATYQKPQASFSTVTRAQVQAELRQAQARGEVIVGDAATSYKAPDQGVSTKTRAEVRNEVLKAQAEGTLIRNREV